MSILKFNAEISKYHRVTIPIESGYLEDTGWKENPGKQWYWNNVVIRKLHESRYRVKTPEYALECESLYFGPENWHYLYLHPTDFTGYASDAEIKEIVTLLREFDIVVGKPIISDVYQLSDKKYEQILADNSKQILDQAKSYYSLYKTYQGFEYDFVEKNRIPCVGQRAGRSSDDVDIRFVRNLINIALNLNLLPQKSA